MGSDPIYRARMTWHSELFRKDRARHRFGCPYRIRVPSRSPSRCRTAADSRRPAPPSPPINCPGSPALFRNDLSWVENVMRVERLLDRAHHFDPLAVLEPHEFLLAAADAVLAGAGALHLDRAANEPVVQRLRFGHFRGTRWIDAEAELEIAVTDMADGGDEERRIPECIVRALDALGERSGRHADIGAPYLRVRPHPHDRVVDVVPRFPQPVACLGLDGPVEFGDSETRRARSGCPSGSPQ